MQITTSDRTSKTIFSSVLEFPKNKIVVQDIDLPLVRDAVSITLEMKLLKTGKDWVCVFHKGMYRNRNRLQNRIKIEISPSKKKKHIVY